MGLGKTICIIAFLSALYSSEEKRMFHFSHKSLNEKPSLVICPATLIDQWSDEIELWTKGKEGIRIETPGLNDQLEENSKEEEEEERKSEISLEEEIKEKSIEESNTTLESSIEFRIYKSSETHDLDRDISEAFSGKKNCIFICSYELFRSKQEELLSEEWRVCVLDQGQRIKNPMAKITQAAIKVRADCRIIMSGTPIQNSLVELWSLFNFVNPGMLGTLGEFEENYKDPILKAGYARARPMDKWQAKECAQSLRDKIKPFILRRQKHQIDSLFPKQKEYVLSVNLSESQIQIYQQYIRALKPRVMRFSQNAALRSLDLLRKLCNHPFLFFLTITQKHKELIGFEEVDFTIQKLKDYSKLLKYTPKSSEDIEMLNTEGKYWEYTAKLAATHFEWSGKLTLLKQLLPRWKKEGHRALIFSQSRKMLHIIQLFVEEQLKLSYLRIDGNTEKKHRIALVNQFNNGTHDLFLLTTKVGGIGINLTGADRVLIIEPDWNPMNDSQAKERALRIGQQKKVEIYRLISNESIEQKIYYRQVFKMFVANKVLNDPTLTKLFQTSQLQDLFEPPGLKKQAEEGEQRNDNLVEYELYKYGSEELRHDKRYEKFKEKEEKRLEKAKKNSAVKEGIEEFEKEIMEQLLE